MYFRGLLRLSTSRKARRVSQTWFKLSQNEGGKLETARIPVHLHTL